MVFPEGEILRPRDPGVDDENDWEEFDLLEVMAVDSANVLLACEAYPVIIRGTLQLEDEDVHLRKSSPESLRSWELTHAASSP
jgi:hypothetical protein